MVFLFCSSFTITNAQTTLPKYTGVFGKNELQHLLRRTMFGATRNDLKYFEGKPMDEVIDSLLNVPSSSPNPPLWNLQYDYGDSTKFKTGKTWIGPNCESYWSESILQYTVNYWWHGLMVEQKPNIQEKMVLFYENFLPSNQYGNSNFRAFHYYNRVKLLHKYSIGNYKELMKTITLDPIMLRYLSMNFSSCSSYYDNSKINPNENFAREVQELYTVGKGKNNDEQLFTEDDVKAAAGVFSGWKIEEPYHYTALFVKGRHCQGKKKFSTLYNNTEIYSNKGYPLDGPEEIDQMYDMLFARKETSENIVRKLYRYFVYAYISDDTETNVIKPLAKVFRDNNFEIKPVLKAMLSSAHFYDKEQVGVMIKNPYDYAVGMMRMLELKIPEKDSLEILPKAKWDAFDQNNKNNYIALVHYRAYQAVYDYTFKCGMSVSNVPDVSGYPAYYQAPDYHHHWINAESLRKRKEMVVGYSNLVVPIVNWRYNSVYPYSGVLGEFIQKTPNANKSAELVQHLIDTFLVQDLSVAEKDKLIKMLETTPTTPTTNTWTTRCNAFLNNPNSPNFSGVSGGLYKVFTTLFDYAEFQLM